MATREFKNPANGAVGEFTEQAARRFGFVPVEVAVEPVPAAEVETQTEDSAPVKGKSKGDE